MEQTTKKIGFADNQLASLLCGERGENLREIEQVLSLRIDVRGSEITIQGDRPSCELAAQSLRQLYELMKKNYPLYPGDVKQAVAILAKDRQANLADIFLDTIFISARKRPIAPRSRNQKRYIEAIRQTDVVFGIGPAGTGKTYLAMAMAVAQLMQKEVTRIILTRPAVEAGEKLGFLPGDLYEKVNPYLRPLYDALHDMMEAEKALRLVHRGTIEVAPLAFMRGRTLNDSFVILDEAQNTTSEQMKMLLTRMGYSSQVVITGDVTQIDLPPHKTSGLVEAEALLQDIAGIQFVHFDEEDVVRHPVVRDIIAAYGRQPERRGTGDTNAEKS